MAEVLNVPCGPNDRPRVGDLVELMVTENDYMHPTTQYRGRMVYLGRVRKQDSPWANERADVFWGPGGVLYCSATEGNWSGNIVSLMKDRVQ